MCFEKLLYAVYRGAVSIIYYWCVNRPKGSFNEFEAHNLNL